MNRRGPWGRVCFVDRACQNTFGPFEHPHALHRPQQLAIDQVSGSTAAVALACPAPRWVFLATLVAALRTCCQLAERGTRARRRGPLALAVGDDLHLDVPRPRHELLNEGVPAGEGLGLLERRLSERARLVSAGAAGRAAASSATGRRERMTCGEREGELAMSGRQNNGRRRGHTR